MKGSTALAHGGLVASLSDPITSVGSNSTLSLGGDIIEILIRYLDC